MTTKDDVFIGKVFKGTNVKANQIINAGFFNGLPIKCKSAVIKIGAGTGMAAFTVKAGFFTNGMWIVGAMVDVKQTDATAELITLDEADGLVTLASAEQVLAVGPLLCLETTYDDGIVWTPLSGNPDLRCRFDANTTVGWEGVVYVWYIDLSEDFDTADVERL